MGELHVSNMTDVTSDHQSRCSVAHQASNILDLLSTSYRCKVQHKQSSRVTIPALSILEQQLLIGLLARSRESYQVLELQYAVISADLAKSYADSRSQAAFMIRNTKRDSPLEHVGSFDELSNNPDPYSAVLATRKTDTVSAPC
jgi:hypothetical protein